jgi:phosphocarrier protein
MKHATVTIPWEAGLHLRPAAKLAKSARDFRSRISLRVNEQMAEARSVLSILMLCAAFGTVVEVQASGEDEDAALEAVAAVFQADTDCGDAEFIERV